jgi:hypothetical protein
MLARVKERSHRFHMERFHHKKLNEVESKEQYCVEVSNGSAGLEDVYDTLSLTLREEYRLKVLENRVLRKIFGPRRDEVRGG